MGGYLFVLTVWFRSVMFKKQEQTYPHRRLRESTCHLRPEMCEKFFKKSAKRRSSGLAAFYVCVERNILARVLNDMVIDERARSNAETRKLLCCGE